MFISIGIVNHPNIILYDLPIVLVVVAVCWWRWRRGR